jgi:NAD(P)-dependent dehydrogenase (short-subunit alcohol dehydrogenase family)
MAQTLKRIADRDIVITGASSGIGLASAQAAARQGAHVVFAAGMAAACATSATSCPRRRSRSKGISSADSLLARPHHGR